jgi:hypothetical protein
LIAHLKVHHKEDFHKFEATRTEEKKAKVTKVDAVDNDARQVTLQQFSSLSKTFSRDHPKQIAITRRVAKMVCRDLQPVSIVNDEGFRDLLKVAEPRYVLPSRNTLMNSIIPELYTERRHSIHQELSSACMVGLALTTDGWTSCTNQSYISFTGHVIDTQFNLKEHCLHVQEFGESHTSLNLARLMKKTVKQWTNPEELPQSDLVSLTDLSKWDNEAPPTIPVFVVTDNASNVTSAVKNLTSFEHVQCFAHTLQLCVNDGIKQFPQFNVVFEKAKAITTHFRHSAKDTKKLMSLELTFGLQQLKLKQECQTRWNTRYLMLQRLLTVKEPVSAILINQTKIANLLPNEWQMAEHIVTVLAPFERVTTIMSGAKYPTVSMVIPILNELKQSLWRLVVDGASEVVTEFCHTLVNNIDSRWPSYELSPLYSASTIVDPRYKDCAFLDGDAAVTARTHVVKYAKKFMRTDSDNNPSAAASNIEGKSIVIWPWFKL